LKQIRLSGYFEVVGGGALSGWSGVKGGKNDGGENGGRKGLNNVQAIIRGQGPERRETGNVITNVEAAG